MKDITNLLSGTIVSKVDSKGRVPFRREWRQHGDYVLRPFSEEAILVAYPQEAHRTLLASEQDKYLKMNLFNPKRRDFFAFEPVSVDRNGRILIPYALRTIVGYQPGDPITLSGVGNSITIRKLKGEPKKS